MTSINEFNLQFCEALEESVKIFGGHIHAVSVPKNNIVFQSVSVLFNDDPVGITIYPDAYYSDWMRGATMKSIIEKIEVERLYREKYPFNLGAICPENAGKCLRASVVGYEANKAWLKDIPHERLADMAVFAKWDVGTAYSTKINAALLAMLRMTKEEMLQAAKENTARETCIQTMGDVMMQVLISGRPSANDKTIFEEQELKAETMYVLTNRQGLDGAASIAGTGVLKRVHELVQGDFYILPSSIHEVLIVPNSEWCMDADDLRQMVRKINRSEVPIQDRLTDNVYEFCGHKLSIAGTDNLSKEMNIQESTAYRRSR